jgi:hypothetical protein
MWVKLGACLARVLCEGYLGTLSTFNRILEEPAKVLLRLFKKPKGCSQKHKLSVTEAWRRAKWEDGLVDP